MSDSDTSLDVKSETNTPKPPNPLESLNSILAFQVQDYIDKKLDNAESRLYKDYINKWLLLFRSILFACQNKTDEAVGLLNQALAKSPATKDSVKELPTRIAAYKKVVENEGVKWPDDKQ